MKLHHKLRGIRPTLQKSLPFLAAFILIGACVGNKKKEIAPASIPPDSPSSQVNFEVDVFPFSTADSFNVLVKVKDPVQNFYYGNLKTIPGVHWEWRYQGPSKGEISYDNASWESLSLTQDLVLPTRSFYLRYKVDMNQIAKGGMPAVGGAFGATTGQAALPSFLFVYPASGDTAIRTIFYAGSSQAEVFSTAPSCGNGCVDFSGLVEALDTPVYVAQDAAEKNCTSENDLLPICATLAMGLEENKEWLTTTLQEMHPKVLEAWRYLENSFGKVPIGEKYAIHLFVNDSCSYQGLEHATSTLSQVGLCSKTGFSNLFYHTVVHESIHVWNGKYLYPLETASWNPRQFNAERMRQLYFYEGFTEGYARLLLAENFPDMQKYLRAKWNNTLYTVSSLGLKQSLEDFSLANPRGAYEAGALLLLKLASLARSQYSLPGAKDKIWSLIDGLRAANGNVSVAFNLALPWGSQRCRAFELFAPCQTFSPGYTKEILLDIMKVKLGLTNWDSFATGSLENVFLDGKASLQKWVEEISAATGVNTKNASDGSLQFEDTNTGVSSWPL